MITVYTPAVSVKLTRLVSRVGGKPTPSTYPFSQIDLTPYLGLQGTIRTIKDIHQPAGAFSITFADKMYPGFEDSIYSLCEPMDYIEIRASRTPEQYAGQNLPIIMRGFVSVVERQESISSDGTPVRAVVISGQDSGKLFLINHVYFQVATVTDTNYLESFHLLAAAGLDVSPEPVSQFMTNLVQNVVNNKIEKLNVFAQAQVKPFIVDATVPDGLCIPQLAQGMDNYAIWQLVELFADQPYNEVFIRDQEDGPHFVFRPTPYRSLQDDSYIMNGATDPGTILFDIKDVVSMQVMRTDARVANFFYVQPGASQLDSNGYISTASLQSGWPLDFQNPNNAPELFGIRKMETGTNLQPQSVDAPINMLANDAQAKGISVYSQWFAARAEQLKLMNRDNSALEEGGMVLRGSEEIAVGYYLTLNRGALTSTQYIEQVSHNIAPLSTWTTSVRFIRGNGNDQRNKASTSPFIAEGRAGPYS